MTYWVFFYVNLLKQDFSIQRITEGLPKDYRRITEGLPKVIQPIQPIQYNKKVCFNFAIFCVFLFFLTQIFIYFARTYLFAQCFFTRAPMLLRSTCIGVLLREPKIKLSLSPSSLRKLPSDQCTSGKLPSDQCTLGKFHGVYTLSPFLRV